MKHIILFILVVVTSSPAFTQIKLDSNKNTICNFQLTAINQVHPAFKAKYSGDNSLINSAESKKLSLTTTLFVGKKLWKNGALYFNPEIAGGAGISAAKGIAGFTNGETFRIGSTEPALYIARLYFQQHFSLKNTSNETFSQSVNQVFNKIPSSRITITVGKISMADFFDKNTYSHDPRCQFMNWSLMSNAAWDYPADTRGYTQGIVAELIKPLLAIRFSSVLVPRKANGLQLDYNITKAHSETLEFEKTFKSKHLMIIRLLLFHTISQAPSYHNTLAEVKIGDSASVNVYTGQTEWKKWGGVKYGVGINAEKEISNDVGAFFKASWNDGKTATWAFTEIDQSISVGINIKGSKWKRQEDNIGFAQVINGISKDHQAFLNSGFYGFIIGDGKLNYGSEAITEIYYKAKINSSFFVSVDYQFVVNPAYNKDRGPVNVFAIRGHIEF